MLNFSVPNSFSMDVNIVDLFSDTPAVFECKHMHVEVAAIHKLCSQILNVRPHNPSMRKITECGFLLNNEFLF